MNRQQLQQIARGFKPLEGTAIVYMLFVKEKKQVIATIGQSDPKGTDFVTMLRKVDSNPNQAIVVQSSIEGVTSEDLVYLSHRYFPYPFIHQGSIYHRIQATDILTVVSCDDMDERLELKEGIGKTWTDEPAELTRKDVLT